MEDYPQDLTEFEARFANEAACRDYLFRLRWPDGLRCPRCGPSRAWPLRSVLLERAACRDAIGTGARSRWTKPKLEVRKRALAGDRRKPRPWLSLLRKTMARVLDAFGYAA
jgi:hypothetical protein